MYKSLGVVWLAAVLSSAVAITQEELAQYVAQQQTAALGAGPAGQARRQAYLLQPKAQAQPQQQIYQFQQPKAAPAPQYQVSPKYQSESEQQYYQVQQAAPQPQAQPQQYYQPRPQPPRKLARPQSIQGLDQEQQEEYDPPQPYQFGFDIKDDEFTNYQNRKEQREGDKISGSYSVVDSDGYIRTVTYTADPLGGFKADVVREPTDIKIKIPQHPIQDPQQQLQYSPAARKQQTQQYLQASAPQPKQQYALRPEPAQSQYQQPSYQQLQYQPQQYQQ